jgi:hypothetical protein
MTRNWRSTATALATAVALAGCALPLTPATAPLAVVFWGAAALTVLKDDSAASVLLHAEARHVLTRADVEAGRREPGLASDSNLPYWLDAWGVPSSAVDRGHVLVVRIGSAYGAEAGSVHGVYLPVLWEGAAVVPGTAVEVRLGPQWPARMTVVHPQALAQGGCSDVAVAPQGPRTEAFYGRALGEAGLASTFECSALRGAGWKRPRLFWVKPEAAVAGKPSAPG